MASAEEIARSYWRAEEARDLDQVLGHFSPDAVVEMPGVRLGGADLGASYQARFERFPKLELTVGRVTGDERRACIEWRAHLTDTEGKQYVIRGANIVEADGQRMTHLVGYFDRKQFDE